ncbi:MAG: type IX secretion system sortase PorU [Flavobacteriales bacterium]|nr:type IX secretion system sortase PorU [Flavobacteriales bacterium]MBP6696407.1 type IX secretion system sortase PorU [Flavobacteriales bacterium]
MTRPFLLALATILIIPTGLIAQQDRAIVPPAKVVAPLSAPTNPPQTQRGSPGAAQPVPSTAGSTDRVSDGVEDIGERSVPTRAHSTDSRFFYDAERADLPYLHETRQLSAGTVGFTAHLTEQVFVPMTTSEVAALPGLTSEWSAPMVRSRLGWERKQPVALVDIYPYRHNTGTGAWERLLSYKVEFVETHGNGGAGVPKSGPATSKLATGDWFRVLVVEDGVYEITHTMLSDMGLNGEVPSDQVNLYGNHFGMLPFENSVDRPSDLLQNAILMEDGGDGQFGPGDRLVFYATGPQRWDLESGTDWMAHTKHVFTDTASYFVGIGVADELPLRVGVIPQVTDPATRSSDSFDDRQFIEKDYTTLLKSGRNLFAETYDIITTYNYNFETPYIRQQDEVCLRVNVLSRTLGATNSSQWRIVSGLLDSTFSVAGVGTGYTGEQAKPTQQTFCFNANGNNLPVTVSFIKHNPVSSIGWMNFLEVNLRRDLKMAGDQLLFRDLTSVGPGEITEFTLDLAPGVLALWDVTNPTLAASVDFADNGIQKVFRLRTDSLRQFAAFRSNSLRVPYLAGRVANQNLHATTLPTDLVIVTPPEFKNSAARIAQRRESEGLTVTMVTPQEVFNEFSSGMRDATAIKRYMKLLYDRAGTDLALMPRYLLLFGDGSYNNLSRSNSNQNWIPSYQTANSWHASLSYCSDDYYGLLDDGEGEYQGDLVDIGVGRLPISNSEQASEMADKILRYDRLTLQSSSEAQCSIGGDGGANDWRTLLVFASDDQEGDGFEGAIHMSQSDQLATGAEADYPCFNVSKIYLDAYQQSSTAGGERYFEAQDALRDQVQRGALVVNYVGHGGEVGWAHERFLDNSTILGWTNSERMPLFMTATCEFSRWDDPGRTSAGEYVVLNPMGGGIGLMTTTRIAYSTQNFQLSQYFYDHVFEKQDELGRAATLGDTYRRTKRDITSAQPTQTNHRNFALLGDPSLRLAVPRNEVRITAITDTLGTAVDTLEALATVRITGEVVDGNGMLLSDLNGLVIPTVFDKRMQQSTLANDGGSSFPFSIRKGIIYRGKATVASGVFSFTFVVPKDISYQVGPGRISCYAENYITNACGGNDTMLVGGTATDVALDEQGPSIGVYMNDERFVRGGITNETPMLLVKLFDQNGINTLGSSIGHDLVAVLDENTDQTIVLNNQYDADLDSYKSGKVRYRFSDLAEGNHTLRVKAWDVFNNSTEAGTEFVVAPSAELALEHVLNYPNPFTTNTQFFFEHNRPCSTLDVQVQVFTVAGRLVKTLNRQLACEGFRSEPMAWDGLDDQGDKLGRGVYVYRLNVVTQEGDKAEKYEKLVILR